MASGDTRSKKKRKQYSVWGEVEKVDVEKGGGKANEEEEKLEEVSVAKVLGEAKEEQEEVDTGVEIEAATGGGEGGRRGSSKKRGKFTRSREPNEGAKASGFGESISRASKIHGVQTFEAMANTTRRESLRMEDEEEGSRLQLAMIHLLALASQPRSSWSFALRSFRVIQRFLSSRAPVPDIIVQGTLAALPTLLAHPWESVVSRSATLLGAMAINSYQLTLQIVNDNMIVKTLLNTLTPKNTKGLVASCHALVDIATSAQGRTTLRDVGAVTKLMCLLSVGAGSITSSLMPQESQSIFQKQGDIFGESAEMIISVILQALEVLIFDDCCQNLDAVPPDVKLSAFKSLQIIWKGLRDKSRPMLPGESILPKLIVWLAMDQEALSDVDYCYDKLLKSLLGGLDTNFEHFWSKHWECSPLLMKEGGDGGETRANLLGKALHMESGSLLLRGILTEALACPPFCADELEPSIIFEEIKGKLGQSLILGQDIRLLKSVRTEHCSAQANTEENYYKIASGLSEMEDVPIFVDVHTCLDAYELGYTVALRGMEFRCPQVAAITEALSICFGQATVGANIYVTPPSAQGLTLHYDDHCVLVWQLSGSKFWEICSPQKYLPRLYSSVGRIQDSQSCKKDSLNLLLMEGDVLYIPRGFPHVASTKQEECKLKRPLESGFGWREARDRVQGKAESGRFLDVLPILRESCIFDGNSNKGSEGEKCLTDVEVMQHSESSISMKLEGTDLKPSCNCMDQVKGYGGTCTNDPVYSLHVTFGVEVEPPFDWEGLVHMSLHCWAKQQSWEDIVAARGPGAGAVEVHFKRVGELYTGLLHVAIRDCGDRYSVFRKACLVAAKPLHQEEPNNCTSSLGDRSDFDLFFKKLMAIIASQSDFRVALDTVLTALDTPEESSLNWMHWLRHLSCKDEAAVLPCSLSEPRLFFADRLNKCVANQRLEELEVGFLRAKDNFVSHLKFEEACESFHFLLQKYRSIRKRFINGMLALQS